MIAVKPQEINQKASLVREQKNKQDEQLKTQVSVQLVQTLGLEAPILTLIMNSLCLESSIVTNTVKIVPQLKKQKIIGKEREFLL